MVFEKLRRICLSVLQPAHVLEAIEEDQLIVLVEPHRVSGFITMLRSPQLRRGCVVVQVARKHRGTQTKLSALVHPHFHRGCDGRIRGHQLAHRCGIGRAATMCGDQTEFGRAVEIAQGNAEGMKAGEQFRRESGAAAQYGLRRRKSQIVADPAQNQKVGQRRGKVSREGSSRGPIAGPADAGPPTVQPAAQGAGIHHHLGFDAGGQHLPLPRREHEKFRADLAHVALHGFGLLGEMHHQRRKQSQAEA